MRIVAFCLALAATASLRADDWPQWMGPNRDGVWRETGLVEKFPADLKPKWKAPVGLGYAGPAVANGKVFVADRFLGDGEKNPANAFAKDAVKGNERVLCFDAKTGEQLWKHEYPSTYRISYAAGPRCTPTVDGDRVYTLGAMGDLFCLNVADGKPVWSKNFMTDYGAAVPVWGFSSHPLIEGDTLICLVGGTEGRLVVAFDKKTGAEVWKSLSFESGDFGYSPPVILELNGKRTLIVWHPKALVGLDPKTGEKRWSVPFTAKAALTAPMARKVDDDKVFVTSFYNGSMLAKVTADGATPVWTSKAKGELPSQTTDLSSIMPTPVVKGEHVYGVDSYGQLRCIEAATGKRVWDTMQATRGRLTPEKVKANPEPSEGAPWRERWSNAFLIENGDRFVLFNEQGELIFAKLSPKGYEEIDRTVILQPTNKMAGRPVVWMHPAFADKCVFARNDEELVCVPLAK